MTHCKILVDEDVVGGEPYLEETRVRVSDIAVKYEKLGYSVSEILGAYPRLERGDVHEALAYYYRNEEEVLSFMDDKPAGAEPA